MDYDEEYSVGDWTVDLARTAGMIEWTHAKSELGKRRDNSAPSRLMEPVYERSVRHLKVLGAGSQLACKDGCAWCCRGIHIEVLAPEAIAIVQHLRDTLSAEKLDELRSRVEVAAVRARSMSRNEYHAAQVSCPLLNEEEERCSIYEHRPLRCRGHISLDASACEAALKTPGPEAKIPTIPDYRIVFEGIALALQVAFDDIRLDVRPFELSSALLVALNEPDAGVQWSRGKRIFDQAISSVDLIELQEGIREVREILNTMKRANS